MAADIGFQRLAALPRSERRAALATLVVGELREVLQMEPTEALPLDESFFDLGFTSLSLEEMKQRLEETLGCHIDAEVLFNHPTVADLLAHLESGPLSTLFGGTDTRGSEQPDDDHEKSLVDDMMARLYQA